MVATGTVLLGMGVGVLGSTVNPFILSCNRCKLKANGAEINNGKTILLGLILWDFKFNRSYNK